MFLKINNGELALPCGIFSFMSAGSTKCREEKDFKTYVSVDQIHWDDF